MHNLSEGQKWMLQPWAELELQILIALSTLISTTLCALNSLKFHFIKFRIKTDMQFLFSNHHQLLHKNRNVPHSRVTCCGLGQFGSSWYFRFWKFTRMNFRHATYLSNINTWSLCRCTTFTAIIGNILEKQSIITA